MRQFQIGCLEKAPLLKGRLNSVLGRCEGWAPVYWGEVGTGRGLSRTETLRLEPRGGGTARRLQPRGWVRGTARQVGGGWRGFLGSHEALRFYWSWDGTQEGLSTGAAHPDSSAHAALSRCCGSKKQEMLQRVSKRDGPGFGTSGQQWRWWEVIWRWEDRFAMSCVWYKSGWEAQRLAGYHVVGFSWSQKVKERLRQEPEGVGRWLCSRISELRWLACFAQWAICWGVLSHLLCVLHDAFRSALKFGALSQLRSLMNREDSCDLVSKRNPRKVWRWGLRESLQSLKETVYNSRTQWEQLGQLLQEANILSSLVRCTYSPKKSFFFFSYWKYFTALIFFFKFIVFKVCSFRIDLLTI